MANLIHKFEKYTSKVIYLINVIDTYFIIFGLASVLILSFIMNINIFNIPFFFFSIFYILFLSIILRKINFFPYFILFLPVFLYLFLNVNNFNATIAVQLLIINILLFFFSHLFVYHIPYQIISRGKISIIFRVIFNSIFTITPNNSSLIVCVFYSTFFSYFAFFTPNPFNDIYAGLLLFFVLVAFIVTLLFLPKSHKSKRFMPKQRKKIANRVIYLNLDGVRLDKFNAAKTPFLDKLKKQGTYFRYGVKSVYPTMTNPAFISILTGTTPEKHKVRNNNYKKEHKFEALPDLVKTSNYGNIHFNDISRKNWDTHVVPISKYGFKVDDILFQKLKKDILEKSSRLFIVDISLIDMIGHSYGSNSKKYLEALTETDKRLGDFFNFLTKNKVLNDTIVIISSDHGQTVMDHGYASKSETEVPLLMVGKGISKNKVLDYTPSITDICPTICYLLNIRYPKQANARVLIEAIKK